MVNQLTAKVRRDTRVCQRHVAKPFIEGDRRLACLIRTHLLLSFGSVKVARRVSN